MKKKKEITAKIFCCWAIKIILTWSKNSGCIDLYSNFRIFLLLLVLSCFLLLLLFLMNKIGTLFSPRLICLGRVIIDSLLETRSDFGSRKPITRLFHQPSLLSCCDDTTSKHKKFSSASWLQSWSISFTDELVKITSGAQKVLQRLHCKAKWKYFQVLWCFG